jgi:hypothetical protein
MSQWGRRWMTWCARPSSKYGRRFWLSMTSQWAKVSRRIKRAWDGPPQTYLHNDINREKRIGRLASVAPLTPTPHLRNVLRNAATLCHNLQTRETPIFPFFIFPYRWVSIEKGKVNNAEILAKVYRPWVAEGGSPASDDVIFVVSQLQRPVETNGNWHRSLARSLQ